MTAYPFNSPPPGLLGELANFIFSAARRPVPEIAVAGAIAYLAGVTGRAFNVSDTGLNQYVLLVAGTGRGKEGARSGVQRFIAHACSDAWHDGGIPNQLPTLDDYTGPADIASGQALIRHIGVQRSCSAFLGEFGFTMQRLSDPRASASDRMLLKVLLDIYHLSGETGVLNPTIYSEKDKNTAAVKSPAFSLYGETSPGTLYDGTSERMIVNGFLPRFLPIFYEGARVPHNAEAKGAVPTVATMRRFAELIGHCAHLNSHNEVVHVAVSDEAWPFIAEDGEVDRHADAIINDEGSSPVTKELWNRAQLKAIKLAALVAVGRDHKAPVITLADAQWAYAVVKHGIVTLADKFDSGEVGSTTDDATQKEVLAATIRHYLTSDYQALGEYCRASRQMHADHIIPLSYIQQRLLQHRAFKNDPTKANDALKRTIQGFIDAGDLQELGRGDMEKYGKRGKAYGTSNAAGFVKMAEPEPTNKGKAAFFDAPPSG